EMRQGPECSLGKARGRQRHRLAGQPFEIAVLAEMDDGMHPRRVAEPGIEGEIAMRRRQIRRVIRGFGVDVVAARRLDRDDDIAAAYRRNGESAAIEPAVA